MKKVKIAMGALSVAVAVSGVNSAVAGDEALHLACVSIAPAGVFETREVIIERLDQPVVLRTSSMRNARVAKLKNFAVVVELIPSARGARQKWVVRSDKQYTLEQNLIPIGEFDTDAPEFRFTDKIRKVTYTCAYSDTLSVNPALIED